MKIKGFKWILQLCYEKHNAVLQWTKFLFYNAFIFSSVLDAKKEQEILAASSKARFGRVNIYEKQSRKFPLTKQMLRLFLDHIKERFSNH